VLHVELNPHAICDILVRHKPAHAFVEKVGPMPRQGIASTWRFAYSAGSLYGILAALRVPISFVAPKRLREDPLLGSPDGLPMPALGRDPLSSPGSAAPRGKRELVGEVPNAPNMVPKAPVGGPSVGFILQPIRAGIDRFNTLSLELRNLRCGAGGRPAW
jgi:hypothetical protein